ncbi:transposase [Arthrobacter sp. 92]|uniref:transposase n=1 Tax=Arthrobacter sp. 92 TaxID=3418175 RepID=UPI003CFE3EB3
MAVKGVDAANAQHTVLPTQSTGSALVVRLADQINSIDAQITDLFRQHVDADILLSMPDFEPALGAAFLANTGGDLRAFETVDRLASVAGLAPAPKDSGRITGNHHRACG